jgi:hypothetical protein
MSKQDSLPPFSPVRLSPLRRRPAGSDQPLKRMMSFLHAPFAGLIDLLRLTLAILIVVLLLALFGVRVPTTAPNPAIAAAPPGRTTVTTTTVTIPTYVVEPALVQEFNPTYNMPYYRLNRDLYDPGRVEDRTYTLIVLENDYLKLTVLPELGGRIYQAIFKPTGNNMFYQNPVLKPSPWGPPEMGWWLAVGGMEWGLPVEEHGYEWGIPWQYQISGLTDTQAGTGTQVGTGGVQVTVWDTDADDRLRAMVTITLLDGQALFHVTPSLENPTDQPIDYKFWLNAMLAPGPANAPGENLRIIMPTDQVTVHSTGDPRLPGPWDAIGWPNYNGVDWSRLGNWRQWFGFFQRPQAAGDFQAVYDEDYDEGVVRAYDSDVAKGAKFFAFGWGADAISPDLYTDDGSAYVEMHGGVAPTFADTHRLEPGQRITWGEQWYPVAGLGGLTWANTHVALHIEARSGEARLHVATSSPRPDMRVLLLRQDGSQVFFDEALSQIMPDQAYHSPWINTSPLSPSDLAMLVYEGDTLLAAYRYEGQLPPPPSTPPPTPTETSTPSPTPTVQPPTETPTPAPTWTGRILRQMPIGGWPSVVRVWVRGQYGLPVIIRSAAGGWSTTTTVGTKPEYGPDALEFAPLGPGAYVVEPQGLGVQVTVDLAPGTIAEILFEQIVPPTAPPPTATPTPTPVPTPMPTPSAQPPTGTATPSPTATGAPPPTAMPTPTLTPTPTFGPSPTATLTPGWIGRELDPIVISGWSSVVRVWVRGQYGLPVTIAAAEGGWSTVNTVGSKPEYGPDALEFAPLGPGRYTITPQGLGVSVTIDLPPGRVAQVIFEQSGAGTPIPTPTPTPIPTPTPPPGMWRVRIPTNTIIPGTWFGVVRVSVQGQVGTLVRIASAGGGWSTTNRTGTKPEYGPTFLEFAPLGGGTYIITAEGIPVNATLELEQGGLAVVLFER